MYIDDIFDLKKLIAGCMDDPSISAHFIDSLYDFIRTNNEITYFSFDDNEKSIVFKIVPIENINMSGLIMQLAADISKWYASYVSLEIFDNNSLSFYLSNIDHEIYDTFKNKTHPIKLLDIIMRSISILNISSDPNNITFKICLL